MSLAAMDIFPTILAIIAVILTAVLLYVIYTSRNYRVFANEGIPYIKPIPGLGSVFEVINIGFFPFLKKGYYKFEGEKVYGYFGTTRHVLVIRDLDMIQEIMVKKFDYFVNRRKFTNEEPLSSSLPHLEDDHWRHVRSTVSPAFTTGKLKMMCAHVETNARTMRDNLQESCGTNQELKEIMSCFSMDAVAGAGFGVNTDSLNNKSSQFAEEARNMLKMSGVKVILAVLIPGLFRILNRFGIGFFSQKSVKFFTSFVDAAIENRVEQVEEKGDGRSDFIQLMVQEGKKQESGQKGISYKDLQAQAFIFLFAGFDTVSTTLSFLFFLLAHNPLATKKIQEEIDELLKGEFPSYESVKSLTYLEMCLYESMRMYPTGFIIDRVCNQDCSVQGINIKKGTVAMFPLIEIYHDPNHFPDPMTFDPERHSVENKEKRHPFAFIPFGQGPRNCIGQRLALLEMKVVIATILQVMTPEPCEKSVNPPRLNKYKVIADDGLWIKFVKRNEANEEQI